MTTINPDNATDDALREIMMIQKYGIRYRQKMLRIGVLTWFRMFGEKL